MFSVNNFPNNSSFVPTSCGARTMILCIWPHTHTQMRTHTWPPEKLCSLADVHYMEWTPVWSISAGTCTWARVTRVSHSRELCAEDAQPIALGYECPAVMTWHCSSNMCSEKFLTAFSFQTDFLFPVPCCGAHTTDLCKDLFVRMHITQRKPWSVIHFSTEAPLFVFKCLWAGHKSVVKEWIFSISLITETFMISIGHFS